MIIMIITKGESSYQVSIPLLVLSSHLGLTYYIIELKIRVEMGIITLIKVSSLLNSDCKWVKPKIYF